MSSFETTNTLKTIRLIFLLRIYISLYEPLETIFVGNKKPDLTGFLLVLYAVGSTIYEVKLHSLCNDLSIQTNL